jgi:hypothetical protein
VIGVGAGFRRGFVGGLGGLDAWALWFGKDG